MRRMVQGGIIASAISITVWAWFSIIPAIGFGIGFLYGWWFITRYSQAHRFQFGCSTCDWEYITDEGIIDGWKQGYHHASAYILSEKRPHIPTIEASIPIQEKI